MSSDPTIGLVIQDMNFKEDTTSGKEGIRLFNAIRDISPDMPVVILTAWTEVETAVEIEAAPTPDPHDPAVIAEMGLAVAAKGMVVVGVEGPAARTGLRRGDIIEGLNGVATPTPRTFDQTLQRAGRLLELTLNRQGKRISLRLRS